MLTLAPINDIINSPVEKADFLCRNTPLVCEREHTVFLTGRRGRGSLLEGKMYNKEYARKWRKRYYKNHVNRLWKRITTRTSDKSHNYYKRGIKNYLTKNDVAFLLKRDNAHLLKKPSIDRIHRGHYTLKNCRVIEWLENCRKGGSWGGGLLRIAVKQLSLRGRFIAEYPSMLDAAKAVKVSVSNIWGAVNDESKTCKGYKWKKLTP